MTALCGGGTSTLKPGIGSSVVVDASLITGGLALISPWLIPLAGFVDGFVFDALGNCASDPPAMPTFTASDITNCIGGAFNPNCSTTISKIHDALLNYLWYQWCQCSSGSPSPAFSNPVQPTGITIPTQNQSTPCFTGTTTRTPPVNPSPLPNFSELCPPGTDTTIVSGGTSFSVRQMAQTPSSISVTTTGTSSGSGSGTGSCRMNVLFWDAAFNLTFNHVFNEPFIPSPPGSRTDTFTITVPPTSVYMQVNIVTLAAIPFGYSEVTQFAYGCGSTTGQPCSPCGSDPGILSQLQQIKQLLTTLQRYSLPFAYINGATHSGLTGAASFAISRLIGVHVSITTIPNYVGVEINTPNALFDVGWISAMDGDGTIHQVRLRQQDTVWMPRHFQECTTFGYSLNPGVVASVTELQAEP